MDTIHYWGNLRKKEFMVLFTWAGDERKGGTVNLDTGQEYTEATSILVYQTRGTA